MSTRMTGAGATLVVALVVVEFAHAQVSVRAGGLVARYGGVTEGRALSIAPRFDANEGPSRATLEVSWSQFSSGPWVLQAGFESSTSYAVLGGAFGISIGASGNVLEANRSWSYLLQGTASYGHRVGPVIAGIGGGLSTLRSITAASRRQLLLIGSAGLQSGAGQLVLRGQHTIDDLGDYSDLTTIATRQRGRLSLEGMVGARFFESGPSEGVWQASMALALTGPVALEASSGRWPTSPDGFTRGFYASGGVRLLSKPARTAGPEIQRLGAGRARVTFVVRGERQVGIGGDWNEWRPVQMRNEGGGRWTAELPLGAGAHKFALWIDEEWKVPDGVPTLPDDFGGRVGLIVL